jgi:glycosyltransferase involved in cell wall biosynthesis
MKCDQCPVGAGLTCLGEQHKPVCRDVAGGLPGRAAQLVAIANGKPADSRRPSARRGAWLRCGLWCPTLVLGGAESWQLALARHTDPSVVIWQGAAVIHDHIAMDQAATTALDALMPVGRGKEAARTLAARCDVIVSWAVDDLGPLLDVPGLPPAVVHACHFPVESPWGSDSAAMLHKVSKFVAVSELALETVPAAMRDRAAVIWNAVDPERLAVTRPRPAMRAAWGVPEDAPVVGYLGRLSAEKEPRAMLRLAAALPEPWHVVVVGDGRMLGELRREAAEQRLSRIHLVGRDPGIGDVLNAFDSLLVPSRYESFGLTIAEGLWAGVPVISTHSGLVKLIPGLVREIDVDARGIDLAVAVLADKDNAVGTAIRVQRAREFARERLAPSRFGREWTNLLQSVAVARVGPAVTACPHRGRSLPVEGCGCGGGAELTECKIGKGVSPGKVTLRDCLTCRGAMAP